MCSTLTWQSTGAQSTVTAAGSTAALLAEDMIVVAIQPAGTEPALKACTPDRKHVCSSTKCHRAECCKLTVVAVPGVRALTDKRALKASEAVA